MLTKDDLMKLSKERLCELLVERDSLEETIEDKIAEKVAEVFKNLQTQPSIQPNPYPNPFQPTTVLYGCPSTQPDVIYGTKTLQDNE